jgi:hypothetical protein
VTGESLDSKLGHILVNNDESRRHRALWRRASLLGSGKAMALQSAASGRVIRHRYQNREGCLEGAVREFSGVGGAGHTWRRHAQHRRSHSHCRRRVVCRRNRGQQDPGIRIQSRQGIMVADLETGAHAIPITYLDHDGKQYVAVMVRGGGFMSDKVVPATLMVYALP